MTNNILFIMLAIAIFALSLFFFQTFGMYAFTTFLVITIVYLMSRSGKPKFGRKKKKRKDSTWRSS